MLLLLLLVLLLQLTILLLLVVIAVVLMKTPLRLGLIGLIRTSLTPAMGSSSSAQRPRLIMLLSPS